MIDIGVPAYFAGKSVLVTGATGSIGKVLVEKLLRSCPDIKTIYLIIRPGRKGENPQDRWNKTIESDLFDKLRKENPKVFSKVIVVQGDNVLDRFGLKEEDVKVLEDNVNIIFHGAANINFAEELRNAVITNMKSTFTLCEMAKKMKNFEGFVHISTAYCNAYLYGGKTEEVVSPAPMDWRALLAVAENPNYSYHLAVLEPRLMRGFMSSYTFTKAMAENIVDEYSQFYPVAIMRVSLVLGSMFEPEPGWADTINILSGFCIAARSGILRTVLASHEDMMPQIPLDICVRSLIIAPWYLNRSNVKDRSEVFCCRMRDENTFTIGELTIYGNKILQRIPWKVSLYYPFIVCTENFTLFKIMFILFHFIPGLLFDKLLELNGKKPVLMKIYRRFWKLAPTLRSNRTCKYDLSREKYLQLNLNLLPEDREDFSLDDAKFYDKETFFNKNTEMVIKIMAASEQLKDIKERSLEYCMRRLAMQRILHVVLVICLGFVSAMVTAYLYKGSTMEQSYGPRLLAFFYVMHTILVAQFLKLTIFV